MTELEQIKQLLEQILELLQPKKEVKTSNSLDEVRAEDIKKRKPEPMDFKLPEGEFCDGWDYIDLRNRSFGFYDRKSYLKALGEWVNNNI